MLKFSLILFTSQSYLKLWMKWSQILLVFETYWVGLVCIGMFLYEWFWPQPNIVVPRIPIPALPIFFSWVWFGSILILCNIFWSHEQNLPGCHSCCQRPQYLQKYRTSYIRLKVSKFGVTDDCIICDSSLTLKVFVKQYWVIKFLRILF